MKDYAARPGAHAVILYREVHSDHVESFERHYYRIKVFTEEGKKYADISIPYWRGLYDIKDIEARTVRPDGTAVEFRGKAFDKVLARTRGVDVREKTFTLPEVEVGSILEYRYRVVWDRMRLLSPTWVLDEKLPTQKARFSLRPYIAPFAPALYWRVLRAPPNAMTNFQNTWTVQVEDIAPFEEEDFMPPEDELRVQVEFFYTDRELKRPEEFWKRIGKERYDDVKRFIGKSSGVARSVALQTVDAADSPEVKLRKLYARVQQLRYLSYERDRTEKEEKRENLKENKNVDDVLSRGYAWANEANYAFVALAQAVGLEASVVLVAARDRNFFWPELMDPGQLRAVVVAVRLGEDYRYFDPATRFCPFDLLPWEETGVGGIRLTEEGGVLITTTQPASAQAIIARKAELHLSEEGKLEGKLEVEFAGLEALRRRLRANDEDETGRRKQLEDEVKGWLPAAASVELKSVSNWESSEEPLRAEFSLVVPDFATAAGQRLLLAPAVFQSNRRHPFEHEKRVHRVYFRHPWTESDNVVVRLPAGYRMESLPAPRAVREAFGRYDTARKDESGAVRLQRQLVLYGYYFSPEYYSAVRKFYTNVRAGDEEQVVLQKVAGGETR